MRFLGKKKGVNQNEDSQESEKTESSDSRKTCFVCGIKFGFLKKGNGIKDIDKQNKKLEKSGYSVRLDIPQGMNANHRICNWDFWKEEKRSAQNVGQRGEYSCWDNLFLDKSTEIMNDIFRLFNPYEFFWEREKITKTINTNLIKPTKKLPVNPKMWINFNENVPSFLKNFNPAIEEVNARIKAIDELIHEFDHEHAKNEVRRGANYGYNLSVDSIINGTLATNAWSQNNNSLKMEIKKLKSEKKELITFLKSQPWQVENQVIQESEKQTVPERSEPLDVLKIRLAKGEITKKEFDEIKPALLTDGKSVQEQPAKQNYSEKVTTFSRSTTTVPEKKISSTSDGLFCTNCGQSMKPNVKFCGKCGTPIQT